MVAGEGQELNPLREQETGALPGTCTLLSTPKQVQLPSANQFLFSTYLTIHPQCWAEAPHLVTAGPAGLPGTIISPEKDAMGKHCRLFPKGAVNPLLLCRWELVLIPPLGLASEHKETPQLHHPASCTCSKGFAGPQLLLHQPPALLSQLSES